MPFALGFGFGLHTGPAIVGYLGWEDRLQYTAIGDTVNLAARLCGQAQSAQILISEEVARSLPPDMTFRPLSVMTLKGFDSPVPVFELLASTDRSAREHTWRMV